jgi:bile-acid 7alpha-dehydratase
MDELADIEARVSLLEHECREMRDVEAIKRLKYKYWRCLDEKLFDELADCFAEEAVADYGPRLKFQTKDAIVEFLAGAMVRFTCVHHGHNPEIEITSDTTARGTWALYNYMIDNEANKGLRIGGFYHDEYVKRSGEWRIRSTTEVNILREVWDR